MFSYINVHTTHPEKRSPHISRNRRKVDKKGCVVRQARFSFKIQEWDNFQLCMSAL